MLTDIC